jgi:hypothetical protein
MSGANWLAKKTATQITTPAPTLPAITEKKIAALRHSFDEG